MKKSLIFSILKATHKEVLLYRAKKILYQEDKDFLRGNVLDIEYDPLMGKIIVKGLRKCTL